MLRLFVALPLPWEVRNRLDLLCGGIPGARWTPEDNFHLTLRFVGEVPESVAADVDDALATIRMPAFDLTLDGVGHFGPLQRARAVWAGVERNASLSRLQQKVDQTLMRAGLPADRRKFVPHVTLARIKGETGHHLADFLARNSMLRIGPIEVGSFALFASYLKPEGPVYEPLVHYSLTGAGPVAQFEAHYATLDFEDEAGEATDAADPLGRRAPLTV